jgi:hypothetical protein
MNKEQIIDFLGMLKAKPAADQNRSGWVISECPMGPFRHDNGKSNPQALGIRIEQGDSFCNCWSCGFHGSQSHLVMELRRLNKQTGQIQGARFGEAMELIETAENNVELDFGGPDIVESLFAPKTGDDNHIFPEDWLQSFAPANGVKWAREYLASRDVSFQMALTLDLRADFKRRRVCCPIRDFKGRLRGLHGRAVDADAALRYYMYRHQSRKNPIVWLGESWVDVSKPIVVVEGFFDVASVRRIYRNVVSPLYATPGKAKILRMSDAMSWVTLLDPGKGGNAGREMINQALLGHDITHLQTTAKDPGASSRFELIELLEQYVELDKIIT